MAVTVGGLVGLFGALSDFIASAVSLRICASHGHIKSTCVVVYVLC